MNIQNIVALKEMLVATGFDVSIGYKLLQYICFKPSDFTITECLTKETDILTCTICFEKKGDDYVCNYYDASLLKAMEIPGIVVQAIDLTELDMRMTETTWQFNGNPGKNFDLDNKADWQQVTRIEGIVTDLLRLSATDEGKHYADVLKIKHWSGLSFNSMTGNLSALRSRFEICQRFYFYDGKGISVDEAHRFLVNRWLEKKLQVRRKQESQEEISEITDSSAGSPGKEKSLLRKKRTTREQKIKR